MLNSLFDLARPALFALDAERAHEMTLATMEKGIYPRCTAPDRLELSVPVLGLTFPNPIGIAAGFDKNARVPDALLAMGLGFAEIGTITPLPQAGNPRPRVFRLVEDGAVINRLGFNNEGHAAALARLRGRAGRPGIVSVNIGANKDTADRAADYVKGLEVFWDVATTFTVNISSPNTPGLRDLQAPEALDALLGRVMEARERLVASGKPSRPILVKIAPDIAEEDIEPITARLVHHKVDGIQVSNTTLTRPGLKSREAQQAGGLSGRPLFQRSTVMLARVHQATGGRIPLIGIGGIDSGETALAKIHAGASLIQLYTGMIFQGPGLVQQIKDHLARAVRQAGARSITDLVGVQAEAWARKPLG